MTRQELIIIVSMSAVVAAGILWFFARNGWLGANGCSLVGGEIHQEECVIPYADGGRECVSSKECSHECLFEIVGASFINLKEKCTDLYYAQKSDFPSELFDCQDFKLIGKCSRFPPPGCGTFVEIVEENRAFVQEFYCAQ